MSHKIMRSGSEFLSLPYTNSSITPDNHLGLRGGVKRGRKGGGPKAKSSA